MLTADCFYMAAMWAHLARFKNQCSNFPVQIFLCKFVFCFSLTFMPHWNSLEVWLAHALINTTVVVPIKNINAMCSFSEDNCHSIVLLVCIMRFVMGFTFCLFNTWTNQGLCILHRIFMSLLERPIYGMLWKLVLTTRILVFVPRLAVPWETCVDIRPIFTMLWYVFLVSSCHT